MSVTTYWRVNDGSELIKLEYPAGNSEAERLDNFIVAAAEAEAAHGYVVRVNDVGRQKIEAVKAGWPRARRVAAARAAATQLEMEV